jgi:YgiT-type zinc finger domain-containing protein
MDALELMSGMTEWRQQHPKATLREMEAELDERVAQLRAKMLEDMAAASEVADWPAEAVPLCPECGQPMEKGGAATRQLTTMGDKRIELKRQYAHCPACGAGFFPSGPGVGPAARAVHAASG